MFILSYKNSDIYFTEKLENLYKILLLLFLWYFQKKSYKKYMFVHLHMLTTYHISWLTSKTRPLLDSEAVTTCKLKGQFSNMQTGPSFKYRKLVRKGGQSSWSVQLVNPAGQSSWSIQLVNPAGQSSWCVQLVCPAGLPSCSV